MKTNKISIYVSNKSNEVLLYHEKTYEVETDHSKFFSSKKILLVFDVGWTNIGYL